MSRFVPSFAVFILVLNGQASFAQALSGAVHNISGAPIPNAAVEAQNTQNKIVFSASSSAAGDFAMTRIPPGSYVVTVKSPGMVTYTHYLTLGNDAIKEEVVLEKDTRDPSEIAAETASASAPPQPVRPAINPAAKDFYAEDAELTFISPALALNNRGFDLSDIKEVKGNVLTIYIPQRGRYLVALFGNDKIGLKLAGHVSGSSLEFQLPGDSGTDDIEVRSTDGIVMGSAVYNVYAMRDPAWHPAANSDHAQLGSDDRAKYKPAR